MKRYKRLYVVLAVLLAACIATFALSRYKAQKEQIQTSGETILSISADEVESLSWDYDGQTLSFHRDGAWSYDDDAAFPVDAEQMDLLLEPFAAFGAAFIIEDVDDLGQYGLDNPVCTIRITAGGESWTIQLGDYSKMDAQRYVSIGDGNVYLAAHDPLDEFDVTLDELIDFDLDVQELERVVRNTSEEVQQKVDWNKLWAEQYPVLASYRQEVDVDQYTPALRELLRKLSADHGYSELDAFLVLKDILAGLWTGHSEQ